MPPQPYTNLWSSTWNQQPTPPQPYTNLSASSWYHLSTQSSPMTRLQSLQLQYQTAPYVFDGMPVNRNKDTYGGRPSTVSTTLSFPPSKSGMEKYIMGTGDFQCH
ncbi:uncharacterized protein M6B38_199600 [Iris pallida]|uniref:Uncharacterized protein n=1 Tax=Iris pallida TaxID=29817 RepID=A0AAX6EAR1_IRIPA|nr:uncharacterized protein M6B38_199600 [Iris pallida]